MPCPSYKLWNLSIRSPFAVLLSNLEILQILPLLEAYAYNAENNISSDPSIQKIEQGEVLLYTKPILLTNALCLSCNGDPKKDIAPETSAKLKELYPQDSATGYAIGDLRGMWALRLPKKEVVKRL